MLLPSEVLIPEMMSEWRHWSLGLKQAPELVRELSGGRTNSSYLIASGNWCAVLRLNASNSRDLGIDREREAILHRLAAADGLAPVLLYCDPGLRYQVTEFVDGRPWQQDDVDTEPGRLRCLRLLAQVQALPVVLPRFDYLGYVESYWYRLQSLGRLSAGLEARRRHLLPTIHSLQNDRWTPVVCHHDFTPGNIIERDGQLLLIDWEYAACGHPDMDLLHFDNHSVDSRAVVLAAWINELWELLRG